MAGQKRHRKLAYQLQNDGELKAARTNQMWHIDITYVPIGRSHSYLISLLDAYSTYSRYIVRHELSHSMTARDVECVMAQALENACIRKGDESPVLISDNGVQLTARSFQTIIRRFGIEHRRIAVGHPAINGKKASIL